MSTNTAVEATDEITEASNDATDGLVEVTEHGELVAPGAFVNPGTIVFTGWVCEGGEWNFDTNVDGTDRFRVA